MNNNSLGEIAEVLRQGKKVVLYPHENMDGDALGSAVAMTIALRKMGKVAWVYATESIPDNLKFLDKGYVTSDAEVAGEADIAMIIDCGELSRIGERSEVFVKAPITIALDHHRTTEAACHYNYVDPESAATGQLTFDLLKEMEAEQDGEMGNALYAAIITDTGRFSYSNTQKITHSIVAELYDWGMDHEEVYQEIYESNRFQRLLVETYAMNTMEMSADGRLAMCYADRKAFEISGAEESETEGVVGKLRAIQGVEVAAFLKERANGTISVSLRTKKYMDAYHIAAVLGGGGHKRAAGATLRDISLEDARQKVRKIIENELLQYGEFN